jgi:F-type H+-transporting ATPase subunit epsilon
MKLILEVITPTKSILKEEVDEITIPTLEGEISVLPNHANLLTKLSQGAMSVRNNNKIETFAILGGFLEVANNHVNILADHAIRANDIEVAKAQEAQERAKLAMKNKQNEADFRVADLELKKALLELKIVKKHRSSKT